MVLFYFLDSKVLELGTFKGHTTRVLSFLFKEVWTVDNEQDRISDSKKLNIDSDLNEQELTVIDSPEAIDTPGNPLYDLNNNDRDVATLNGLIDKYGLKAVQLWITSGEYSKDYM